VLTYGQKGPGGEGVGEEGLDAVAAWCSEAEEGGGAHGDGSDSVKGEDGALPRTAIPASFSSSSPPTSAAADWGREAPIG
jgi:hypothetical protein